VPKLIERLGDESASVRRAACAALGAIGDVQAVPKLIERLEDGDENVRQAACWALGKIGKAGVWALSVLAQVGDKAAQEALQQMGQSMMSLEEAVGELVRHDHWSVVIRALSDQRVWELVVGLGTQAVPALIAALGDGDVGIRRAAAKGLGKIWSGIEPVSQLIQKSGDQDGKVRWAAVEALGQLRAVEAVPALIKRLKDEDEYVRQAAIEALGQVGVAAMPMLFDAAQDRKVRPAVAQALGMIGVPAVPILTEALKDPGTHVRLVACEALGVIGDPAALQPLLAILKDPQTEVRRAALEALQQIEAKGLTSS
jgi:HEAT repeat protein